MPKPNTPAPPAPKVHAMIPVGNKIPLDQFVASFGAPDAGAAIAYQTGIGFTGTVAPSSGR